MKNNENDSKQKTYFIYVRSTGEKVPVSKAQHDAFYKEADRIRHKEQDHGRCIVNGIKSTISNVFNTIWSTVSGIVNKLKSVFNFSWSLPKIKLPHFSITGSFSLNPPSIPHFSVDWYKKAMSGGMILKDATIFGQSGGTLLGGGEAGDEAVVGVSSLRSMIQDAVQGAALSLSGDQPLINIQEMSVRSDDDIRKISQQLNTLLNAGRRAKGYI